MNAAGRDIFVGIDAGTTGVTVILFDAAGGEMASAYQEYECRYPHPGWVEQDMDEVWGAICSACRAATTKANLSGSKIHSIGLSSQRGTFALLDKEERNIAPAIVWNDSRAQASAEHLATRIDPARYREVTGMPLSAAWAVAKVMWIAERQPQVFERTRWIVNGQEYFLRRMGAAYFETDPASLALNGMLDIRQLDWSDEILTAAGIGRELLPPVGQPATRIGHLSAAAADATGLPVGTAICRGGGDQQCAAVGAGVIRQGMAEITVGTSAMMVAHLDHIDLARGMSAYVGGHAIPGCWELEGGAFAIGSCLRWWRDQLGVDQSLAAAGGPPANPYDLIVAEALTAPPGSRGAMFHPFFAGQVTPNHNPAARGAFLGLGLHHNRADLVRALLEGCACEMRLMAEALDRDLEGGIDDLRVTGGGTKNVSFVQIQADVIGRPITIPRHRECTVLGAAILGAVAVGAFSTIHEAVSAMVGEERVIEPTPGSRALYDELFGVFVLAYETLAAAAVYDSMYRFQSRFF